MINNKINNGWQELFDIETKKDYYKNILISLENDYKKGLTIYPEKNDIFNRFLLTSFDNLKVVILGQDPYHGEKEAHGLSFSVKNGVKIPPSLRNIFKELKSDLQIDIQTNGDLTKWSQNGVLLLNSILTVIKDNPASHKKIGWEIFTDNVIKYIGENKENIVFILWGNYAIGKKYLIDNKKHFIITSPHPSPFSANKGFFGSKVFSKTNSYLISKKIKPINW